MQRLKISATGQEAVAADTEAASNSREDSMNVGAHIKAGGGGERLPLLDSKLFNKLKKNDQVVGKMLACREINSPGKKGKQPFHGLAMDFKNGSGEKFAFLARFDRWDIGAIALQCGSEETDDWIGQSIKFVSKKGDKGTFINVLNPKSKKQ